MKRLRALRWSALMGCVWLLSGCEAGDLTLPAPPTSSVTVTALVPAKGYAGDRIRIRGSGFGSSLNGVEVLFNGGSARPESIEPDGSALTVRIPTGVESGTLIVQSSAGRGTSKEELTYLGAGHLQRPGIYSTFWLSAGLGNIAQIDGELWVHATEMNQFVQPWPQEARARALIADKLIDLSPKGDAQGRLVFISENALYAALPADLLNQRPPELIANNFGPVPLSRVFVMANGTSAVLVQGPKLISVDLMEQDHKTQTVMMGEGPIVGMLESGIGKLIIVRRKLDGKTSVDIREPVTLQPIAQTDSPEPLSGAMVTWKGAAKQWLAFAGTNGSVRYVDLGNVEIQNKFTNLFVDEPASDLLLSPDATVIYSALPKHGRVTASSVADWTVQWSVQVPGEPTKLAMNSEGRIIAVDPRQNSVYLIDPVTRSTLGERQIGLGLGSRQHPKWGARVTSDTAYALARDSLAIGAMDLTTFERRLGAALLRTPMAFAISPDASTAVVVHDDNTIGLTSLEKKSFKIERMVCGGVASICEPITPPLVGIDYLSNDRVLIATATSAKVYRLPEFTVESQKTPPAGSRFAGAVVSSGHIGLVTASGTPVTTLKVEEYALASGLSGAPARTLEEQARAMDGLLFLGADAFRRSDLAATGVDATGLAYFYSRLADPRGRTLIGVPDRSEMRTSAAGFTGAFPLFAPDGRQVLGLGAGPTTGMLMISEGDPLGSSGLQLSSGIDLGVNITGLAYTPDGETAFVVDGDRDRIFQLE